MTIQNSPDDEEPSVAERAFIKLWGDVDDQAEDLTLRVANLIERPDSVGKKYLIFYRQGLNAINATLLLLSNGMFEPAAATARLAFENLFCATACNEDPTYFSQLEISDEYEMNRWVRDLEKNDLSSHGISAPPSPPLSRADKRDYKVIACKGQISNLYNENYRHLSKIGAHANTLTPELSTYLAGGPLPEFNLMVGVLHNLELCLEHFEKQLVRVS